MSYLTLKKVFHAQTKSAADQLFEARARSESALHWDFPVGDHSLFCLITPEITSLVEKIYSRELTIQSKWLHLPFGARTHYVRALLLDEVMFTNAIEGVTSTRRQIQDALAEENRSSPRHRRFRELSHLYLTLGEGKGKVPESPADIREIYDNVMDGELSADDLLDGELFRAGSVDITDAAGRSLHRGFHPEEKILRGLEVTLQAMSDTASPPLVCAIMSHFMFEAVHPFYDGNGRTGRYLLGLRLSRLLSSPTALTLSRVLHEDRKTYYRAFTDVEEHLNRGDGTPFALALLRLIFEAQGQLEEDLSAREYLLRGLTEKLQDLQDAPGHGLSEHGFRILFLLGQVDLFGTGSGTKLDEIAEYLDLSSPHSRRYLTGLEEQELIATITKRPLRFTLTTKGRLLLGLTEQEPPVLAT